MLEDNKLDVKVKLAGLWTSVMFCYIYADYFGLYEPGKLQQILAGKMGPLGTATPGVLVGTSAMMSIPSLMIFLSLALKAGINRWVNVVVGTLFTAIILLTMWAAPFFIYYGVLEVTLTGLVVAYALRWPRRPAS
jgi:hypothetical protein